MRTVNDHLVVGSTHGDLTIEIHDEPGPGGAHHLYTVSGYDPLGNPSCPEYDELDAYHTDILFQNGPIQDGERNGLTIEALIAVCIDRLRCFQDGSFACKENGHALQHLQEALLWLHSRTHDRMRRQVEGKMEQ